MADFLSITQEGNTLSVDSVRVSLPRTGCWLAQVVCPEPASLEGPTTVTVGDLTLVGQADPTCSTTYLTRTHLTVVGGLGWRNVLPARHYHNDAGSGVKLSNVLQTTAGEAGETINVTSTKGVGVDYVRLKAPASVVLRNLAPDWYVAFDGTTRVEARQPTELADDADGFEVLSFDPVLRVVSLKVTKPSVVVPGVILRGSPLERAFLVTSVEINIDNGKLSARAGGYYG
ncbi:MAG: hypothetical protein H6718_04090 [Polyangiaceae bacterium]|nr:hypothetical protein [Polyangiaceae bacterium]